jgi:CheY-like chemotaxis protein
MSHQIKQYQAVGMDGHVAKPIEIAALYQALTAASSAGPEAVADAADAA